MNSIVWMILETLASLLASACMLRAYAWRMHLSPHNPLSQFFHALTNWLVTPVAKLVAPTRTMDWASLVSGLIVALVAALLFYLISGLTPDPVRMLILAFFWLARWTLYLVMGLVILTAVISMVNPHAPLAPALNQLSEPILRPFRRVIPLVGSFDLSPLVLILVIQVLLMVLDPRAIIMSVLR